VLGHNQMLKCAFTDNQVKQFFNDNLSLSEGMYDILKKARRKKSKVTLKDKQAARIEKFYH